MSVAVIGGGYLGTLIAVGLARAGRSVTLYESRSALLQGASFVGEGKVHLGLVYALGDAATAEAMLRGALAFDASLERLLGAPLDWQRLRGGRFDYVVAEDSLVSEDEFLAHGDHLDAIRRRALSEDPNATYLGASLDSCMPRSADGARRYRTEERYVDVTAMTSNVLGAVQGVPNLRVRLATAVTDAEPVASGWTLRLSGASAETARHDLVVNCSWENSARLDAVAGLEPPTPNLRLRAFVHGRTASPPVAVTVVHGPYGDAVVRPDGSLYASWYPSGLLGFTVADRPPPAWESALGDPATRAEIVRSTVAGLSAVVPGLGSVTDARVHARIVVAEGDTDICDPGSKLHSRNDGEIVSRSAWISPRSRKLTTIPAAALAAVLEAERLLA